MATFLLFIGALYWAGYKKSAAIIFFVARVCFMLFLVVGLMYCLDVGFELNRMVQGTQIKLDNGENAYHVYMQQQAWTDWGQTQSALLTLNIKEAGIFMFPVYFVLAAIWDLFQMLVFVPWRYSEHIAASGSNLQGIAVVMYIIYGVLVIQAITCFFEMWNSKD